jgi:hypothetical protein
MRYVYTVEDVKNCHFRLDADHPDANGKLTKLWDPSCPYCGSRLFRRWWKHEYPDLPNEEEKAAEKKSNWARRTPRKKL